MSDHFGGETESLHNFAGERGNAKRCANRREKRGETERATKWQRVGNKSSSAFGERVKLFILKFINELRATNSNDIVLFSISFRVVALFRSRLRRFLLVNTFRCPREKKKETLNQEIRMFFFSRFSRGFSQPKFVSGSFCHRRSLSLSFVQHSALAAAMLKPTHSRVDDEMLATE